jgi:5-methylcytosine-specific restriction endonuclease McrA
MPLANMRRRSYTAVVGRRLGKSNRNQRRRAIVRDPSHCYLCGLFIPTKIVSSVHPLFGTVDHVVARSRNGADAFYNRYPAHRVCNRSKGDRLINPEEFALEIHRRVVPLLERLGYTVTPAARRRAIGQVVHWWPSWAPILRHGTNQVALQRWEDDGGAVNQSEALTPDSIDQCQPPCGA